MMNDDRKKETIQLDPRTKQRISQNYAANGGFALSQANAGQAPYQANDGFGQVDNSQPVYVVTDENTKWKFFSRRTLICAVCIIIVIIVVIIIATQSSFSVGTSSSCGGRNQVCCGDSETFKCLPDAFMLCSNEGICDIPCGDHGKRCCYDGFTQSCKYRRYNSRTPRYLMKCNIQDGKCY